MQQGPYQGSELEAKRAGHILGIKGGAAIKASPILQTVVAQTELNYNEVTSKYILEKLKNYKPPAALSAQWRIIHSVFDETAKEAETLASLPKSLPDVADDQISRYQAGQPVHVCSGWKGHHIGVTFYNGYMIVSNRGDRGVENKGSIIYKLKKDLSAADLIALQNAFLSDGNYRETEAKLRELQGTEVGSFPQKPQKYGTCSYVNKVAATEGLLCLLTLQNQKQLNDSAIRAYTQNSANRQAYKDFTHAARESEIDRMIYLIRQGAQGRGEKEQLAVMVNVAFSVVMKYQRNDPDLGKRKIEIERANRLLQAIEPYQKLLSSENKDNFAKVKSAIENRLMLLQPLLVGNNTLNQQMRSEIEKIIGASYNPLDRMPPWYMDLLNKIGAAKTLDEVVKALDNAYAKFASDQRLQNVNVEVRTLLRKAVEVQPVAPVVPRSPVQPRVLPATSPSAPNPQQPNRQEWGIAVKERIHKMMDSTFNVMDRMPPWYVTLTRQIANANSTADIRDAFNNAAKKWADDTVLRELTAKVNQELDQVKTQSVNPSEPAFELAKKEIMNHLPKQSQTDAAMFPSWFFPLSFILSDAKNVNDIVAAFASLKENFSDKEFNKIVDKSFETLVHHAKDISDIIKIVENYPKDQIRSPSGSSYDRNAVVNQLKKTPLQLDAVTSALGIRKRVSELQGTKMDVAPHRNAFSPKSDSDKANLKKEFLERNAAFPPRKNQDHGPSGPKNK